jgi:hypothetical protein
MIAGCVLPIDVAHEIQVLDLAHRMALETASNPSEPKFIRQWAIERVVDLEAQKLRLQRTTLSKAGGAA